MSYNIGSVIEDELKIIMDLTAIIGRHIVHCSGESHPDVAELRRLYSACRGYLRRHCGRDNNIPRTPKPVA